MADRARAEGCIHSELQYLTSHDSDEGSIRDGAESNASPAELVPGCRHAADGWSIVPRRKIRRAGTLALVVFIVAVFGLWAGFQPLFKVASHSHRGVRSAAADIITEDSLVSLVPNGDAAPTQPPLATSSFEAPLATSSFEAPLATSSFEAPEAFSPEPPTTPIFSEPPTAPPLDVQTEVTTTELCHTAQEGEPCFKDVKWAVTEGIDLHPDWYPGLDRESSIESFQKIIHEKGKCPPPCDGYTIIKQTTTTPRPWRYPALFCFSVAMVHTYEMKIVRAQRAKGAGIFACEGQSVLSQETFYLGGGMHTLVFEGAAVGRSKDGTAANAQVFMNAWTKIFEEGQYADYHFTVKMDPDAVLVPDRLRPRIADHVGKSVFFENCNMLPGNPAFPMMFGAMEVLSTEAVEAYVSKIETCKQWFSMWRTWGEDVFITTCLKKTGVTPLQDFKMLQDDRCLGVDCTNQDAAGFHEFKSVGGYFNCWGLTMSAGDNETQRLS